MENKKIHKAATTNDVIEAYIEDPHVQHTGEASSRTDILLKNFSDASKRSRISLLALSIASILISFGIFNHQWSWLATKEVRQHEIKWPDDLKDPIDPNAYVNNEEALIAAINRLSENSKPTYPREQIHDLLDVQMKTIEVPILGIQIYIEDMPILGGLGISFLLLWLYFVRRRERSIVKMLHSIATFAKPAEKKYQIKKIYTTLAFSQVFNTIPRVDKIKKSKFRKRISKLQIKPPLSKIFYYFTPFVPCFVFAFVIGMDCKETFFVKSDQRLIPNVKYIDSAYSVSFKNSGFNTKAEFADLVFKDSTLKAFYNFKDAITKIRQDQDTAMVQYKKDSSIKTKAKNFREKIKKLKESIYKHGTTYEYFRYNEYRFKEFLHNNARLPAKLTLSHEIIWIRTVFPILILLFNFILAKQTATLANSRDYHMQGIFIQYEKYYPQNYNIYTIGYAYVSILIQDKNGKGRNEAVIIKAKNNYRTSKTNEHGLARFIELQNLDDKETLEFYTKKNGKSVMILKKEMKLEKIERFNSAKKTSIMPASPLKNQILNLMHENSSKPIRTVTKKSILGKLNPLFRWGLKDNRNKPICAVSNQPISRIEATNELVLGEMLINITINGNKFTISKVEIG